MTEVVAYVLVITANVLAFIAISGIAGKITIGGLIGGFLGGVAGIAVEAARILVMYGITKVLDIQVLMMFGAAHNGLEVIGVETLPWLINLRFFNIPLIAAIGVLVGLAGEAQKDEATPESVEDDTKPTQARSEAEVSAQPPSARKPGSDAVQVRYVGKAGAGPSLVTGSSTKTLDLRVRHGEDLEEKRSTAADRRHPESPAKPVRSRKPSYFLIIKEPPFPESYDEDVYLARVLGEMYPSYSFEEYESRIHFLVTEIPGSEAALNRLVESEFPDADLQTTVAEPFEDTHGGRGVRISVHERDEGEDVEADDPDADIHGRNAELIAATSADEVDALLSQGADVNATDELGKTPLMNAAYYGRKDVVKRLLERGAEVDARYVDGCTALIWAAGEGEVEIVQMLLEHGANIGARESHGYTAFMIADKVLGSGSRTGAVLADWERGSGA